MAYRAGEELWVCDVLQFWPEPGASGASRSEPSPEARAMGLSRALSVPFMPASGRALAVDCTRRIVAYRGRRYEIVIYRDAAERLAGEEARREAASLRSVNLLAQAAAHEINNPLAIIMGYVQMLEDRLPPRQRGEQLDPHLPDRGGAHPGRGRPAEPHRPGQEHTSPRHRPPNARHGAVHDQTPGRCRRLVPAGCNTRALLLLASFRGPVARVADDRAVA